MLGQDGHPNFYFPLVCWGKMDIPTSTSPNPLEKKLEYPPPCNKVLFLVLSCLGLFLGLGLGLGLVLVFLFVLVLVLASVLTSLDERRAP